MNTIDEKNYAKGGINYDQLVEIIKKAFENPVSIITADTGSGKSTLVPVGFAKLGGARIFCAQPTNFAVQGLHRRVKSLNPDINVGYEIEGITYYNDKDQIIYCTSGHLKSLLLSHFQNGKLTNKKMFCDVIMLDEAHTGKIENDIIMGLWAKINNSENQIVKKPRLVLSSATLGLTQIPFPLNNNITQISVKRYNVEEYYDENAYITFKMDIYKSLAEKIDEWNEKIPVPSGGSRWLAFVAGKAEIFETQKYLKCKNVVAYAEMDEKQKKELDNAIYNKSNERIIIIATNIAEASVTIDNLDGVFDTLIEKVNVESETGAQKLDTRYISKSSAEQRKGRTGRQMDGFVYRMMPKTMFDKLEDQRVPEIVRLPLYSYFLEIVDKGLDPEDLFLLRIGKQKIRNTFEKLIEKDLIRKKENYYTVSDSGRFVASINFLGIETSLLIYEWLKTPYPLFPCIVAVCLIENASKGYMYYRNKEYDEKSNDYYEYKLQRYDSKFKKFEGKSILETYLRLWDYYITQFQTIDYNEGDVKKWCNQVGLNNRNWSNLVRSVKRLKLKLGKDHFIKLGRFNINKFLDAFQNVLGKVYKSFVYVNGKSYTDNKIYARLDNSHFQPNQIMYEEIYAFSMFVSFKDNIISFYHPKF